MAKKSKVRADEKYSDKEAKRRFEAALLGAKLAQMNTQDRLKKGRRKKKAAKKAG